LVRESRTRATEGLEQHENGTRHQGLGGRNILDVTPETLLTRCEITPRTSHQGRSTTGSAQKLPPVVDVPTAAAILTVPDHDRPC